MSLSFVPVSLGAKEYTLGQDGQAGIVFYIEKDEEKVEEQGWRYLEAAKEDEEGTYQWKICSTKTLGTETAIGSGYVNTYDAMFGEEYPAAEVVRNKKVVVNGVSYSDWFLPSKDELNELYLKKDDIGGFTNNWYWSSSEKYSDVAWKQTFPNGFLNGHFKTNRGRVRAVRTF